jgi:membrane protease YdiL (CAAX protease family)
VHDPELTGVASLDGRTPGVRSRLGGWLRDAPAYPADAGDRRTADILGLALPVRATIAVLAVSALVLLDYHGRIDGLVEAMLGPFGDSVADAKRLQSIGRLLVMGGIPLAIIVLVLRDRPPRYGLRLGDWRAGATLALGGAVVMTPLVLAIARVDAFSAWYAPQGAGVSPADVFLTTALEVIPAEFFFRGFLLFALLRVVGPIAVVLATLPFAFVHLGKPEVETLSTLLGGIAYGWLDWRTGSVLWSGLAHTWILGLVVIAAAAGTPAT